MFKFRPEPVRFGGEENRGDEHAAGGVLAGGDNVIRQRKQPVRGEAEQRRRFVQPEIELHIAEFEGELGWAEARGVRHLPASPRHDFQT